MRSAITKIAEQLDAFLRWWVSELVALVPSCVCQMLFPAPKFLLADLSEADLSLWYLRGNRLRRLRTIRLEGKAGGEVREQVLREVRHMDLKRAVTVLRLPTSKGLCCRLTLPIAAEEDLRSALALQVDRQTPLAQENAAFDYRILERDRRTRQVKVEMAVAPSGTVTELQKCCESWGLSPGIVDLPEEGADVGPPRFNLTGDTCRPKPQNRAWFVVNVALALTAAVLLVATVYLPVHKERQRGDALQARVAEAKSVADEVLLLRGELDERQDESRFFAKLRASTPQKILILEELTRILPDDSWVRRFSVSGGEIRITGYSPTASSLVGIIDESELFATPKFLSTVTTETDTGLESFKFSFELEKSDRKVE